MNRGHVVRSVCVLLLCAGTVPAAEVQYTAKTLRDPFADESKNKPVDDTAAMGQSFGAMKIQGILYSAENPVAIIDGKIYRVGSRLGAGKVVQIERESVVVALNDKQFTIKQSRGKTNAEQPTKPQTNK